MSYIDLHVSGADAGVMTKFSKELGWDKLCFIFDTPKPGEVPKGHFAGFKINAKNDRELMKKINLVSDYDVVLVSGDNTVLRKASTMGEVDVLARPEEAAGHDYMHQRDSGLDKVIVRNCAENDIAVELDFSQVLNSKGSRRARIIGRMAQNIELCQKYGAMIVITSGAKTNKGLRNPKDMASFFSLLGLRNAELSLTEVPKKLLT